MNRRINFQLALVALLVSSLQLGCSFGDGSIPGELEVSKIENDPAGRYRVFVKSRNPKILNKLRIDPTLVKELYLWSTDANLLQSLGDYPNLDCLDLTALPYEITSFDFLANLPKLKVLGIHTTAVNLAAAAKLQQLPQVENLHIDCVAPNTNALQTLAAIFPQAKSSNLFCYSNEKDLLARQILSKTENHYLVAPSNEQTSIPGLLYGKARDGFVSVTLKNANPQAIQCLADLVELRKLRIDSPDINYAQVQAILKNTALKTLDLRRLHLSETELEQLRNQYSALTIEY